MFKMYPLFQTFYHCTKHKIFSRSTPVLTGSFGLNVAFVLLMYYFFSVVPEDVREQNVSEWVNSERYEAFVHVTRSNFHDITETGKYV